MSNIEFDWQQIHRQINDTMVDLDQWGLVEPDDPIYDMLAEIKNECQKRIKLLKSVKSSNA